MLQRIQDRLVLTLFSCLFSIAVFVLKFRRRPEAPC